MILEETKVFIQRNGHFANFDISSKTNLHIDEGDDVLEQLQRLKQFDYSHLLYFNEQKQTQIIQKAFYETCCKMHSELCNHTKFSAELSGTTLTSLFLSGDRLHTANVGDSRIILISFEDETKPSQYAINELTRDHKPNDMEESRRIYAAGGKVSQAKDIKGNLSGPYRIYNKKLMNPGLAMSRSLGDHFAHTLGCSCEPDFLEHQLKPSDRIVVLASDGVWEYLSNN